jgi:hypothetical protein
VHAFVPLLETILDRFGSGGGAMPGRLRPPAWPRPDLHEIRRCLGGRLIHGLQR